MSFKLAIQTLFFSTKNPFDATARLWVHFVWSKELYPGPVSGNGLCEPPRTSHEGAD